MHQLNRPIEVNGQRTSALRTTDLRVLALWHVLVWFRLLPCGFAIATYASNWLCSPGKRPPPSPKAE